MSGLTDFQAYGGVMGANFSLSIDLVRDGASNTVLVGELRAGVLPIDPRGTWAMSGTPSAMFAHGWMGDDNGPNCNSPLPDDVGNCMDITAGVGGPAVIQAMNMACYNPAGANANNQQTARSMHLGGVTMLFVDGSVHFISDYVQLGSSSNLGVWDMLNLSNDHKQVQANRY